VHTVKAGVIKLTKKTQALKILRNPLAVTLAKIGNTFLVDPTADEEEVLDARLTVTFDEKGNICTIQKGGSDGITTDELHKALELAKVKAKELRKHL
jgi:exosome complex component RRP42